MIDGIRFHDLTVREDERGELTEIASESWHGFENIPHVYKASCRTGVIKAFHAHLLQTDRFYCLLGTTKIGLIDLRGPVYEFTAEYGYANSPAQWLCHVGGESKSVEFGDVYPDDAAWMKALSIDAPSSTFGDRDHAILSGRKDRVMFIPPGIAHGQMAVDGECCILNMPTRAYDRKRPDEVRLPFDFLEFPWEVGNR